MVIFYELFIGLAEEWRSAFTSRAGVKAQFFFLPSVEERRFAFS